MTARSDAAAAAALPPAAGPAVPVSAVVILPDCGERSIELTVLMIGQTGGVIQLSNHEPQAQRVQLRLPGRQLSWVRALGDGGRIPHACDDGGSSIVLELPAREILVLRFADAEGPRRTVSSSPSTR